MSRRIYRADIGVMRPLHPAWSLWLTDLFGLNVSLVAGRILMTTRSWREHKKDGPFSALIWHELQHRRQKLEAGYLRFFLRYFFSRRWRARYEREAYEVTMAHMICHTDGHGRGANGDRWALWLVGIMSGWRYGWMMGEREATEWAFSLVEEIVASWGNISFGSVATGDHVGGEDYIGSWPETTEATRRAGDA